MRRSGSIAAAEPAQDLLGPRRSSPRVDDPEARLLAAEEEVLPHGERGHEVELLVDRGDPRAQRVDGPSKRNRRAVQLQLTRVGSVGAGDDLDERALAGAVLADQRVDLARADLEVRASQGMHAGEALLDTGQAEERRVHRPPAGRGSRVGPRPHCAVTRSSACSAAALSFVNRSQGIRIVGGTSLPAM